MQMVPVNLIVPPPEGTPVMHGIDSTGIAQSVLLKTTGDQNKPYIIVDGNRRIASALHFGIKEVAALITDGTRGQIAAMSAILNSSRGPNPVDEARNWHTALTEGQFADIKSLAQSVHVHENTIKARLKLLRLPESILEHVGVLVAEGVAERMAKLPDEYRERAIQAAEIRLDAGEKFTAADLKAVSVKRQDDLANVMSNLFDQQPVLIERNPVGELASEVQRLARIEGVCLNDLIAELSRRAAAGAEGENQDDLLSHIAAQDDQATGPEVPTAISGPEVAAPARATQDLPATTFASDEFDMDDLFASEDNSSTFTQDTEDLDLEALMAAEEEAGIPEPETVVAAEPSPEPSPEPLADADTEPVTAPIPTRRGRTTLGQRYVN